MLFKLHQIDGYIETIFIAEYIDKILILDGGCRSDAKIIEDFVCKTLERPINDIKLLFVSHTHPDHLAAAQILRKKYGIPIAAYFDVDEWYKGFGGSLQHFFDIIMGWYVVFAKKLTWKYFWYPKTVNPEFKMQDNDMLPGFDDWAVIYAPGHTSVDCLLYNKENEMLYAVDTLVTLNDKRKTLPFPINEPEKMKQTLIKLSKLKIKTLLLAHGGIIDSFDAEEFLKFIPNANRNLTILLRVFRKISTFSPMLKN